MVRKRKQEKRYKNRKFEVQTGRIDLIFTQIIGNV